MHPRSIEPAMRKNILVRVKNTFNPSHPGTVIVTERPAGQPRGQGAHLYRQGRRYQHQRRPDDRETGSGKGDLHHPCRSRGERDDDLAGIVRSKHLAHCRRSPPRCGSKGLLQSWSKQGIVREVSHNHDVCAVAVVGAGMAGAPGTGGRIFTALGKAGVNVMMISQGSSEANISFRREPERRSAGRADPPRRVPPLGGMR